VTASPCVKRPSVTTNLTRTSRCLYGAVDVSRGCFAWPHTEQPARLVVGAMLAFIVTNASMVYRTAFTGARREVSPGVRSEGGTPLRQAARLTREEDFP
jgi:hypothetical protein